jgi:NitT/TauT family transport system substrate-binding protein
MNINAKLIFLILLIPLISVSCSGLSPNEKLPSDFGPLKVGYIPINGRAPFYVAVEKGYFEEQGLEIDFQSFGSASYMMPLLATGDLDVGSGQAGAELFNAVYQNLDVKITAGLSQHRKGHATLPLMVRRDLLDSGTISQPADLKGAKVALNVERGIAEVFLAEALSSAGLTLQDVEVVTLRFPDMNVAFSNSAIDAAIQIEPLATQAENDGLAVKFLNSDEIFENPQVSVIYFGKRLLEPANREVGVRFFDAYLKAVRELNTEAGYTDEVLDIINKYTEVEPESIKNSIKAYMGPNGELNLEFLEYVMNYYINQGYTELTSPVPLEQMIDTSFLDAALDRIGKFEE